MKKIITYIKFEPILFVLLLLSSFSILMLFVRLKVSHSIYLFFLIWNLILAFIPYLISIYLTYKIKIREHRFLRIFSFIIWLLFLPNSFYILTDFKHLFRESTIPFWYDLLTISVFAITGFLAGLFSTLQMQQLIQIHYSKRISLIVIAIVLYLSGLGVYLGRYLRFNSWDVLHKPMEIFQTLIEVFFDRQALQFSFGFGTFILVFFCLLYAFIEKPFLNYKSLKN